MGKTRAEAKTFKNPVPATAESLAAGRELYSRSCASCHGETGKGDGGGSSDEAARPANFAARAFKHGSTDGDLYLSIHDGIEPEYFMEPFSDRLNDTEIWNLINYIRTLAAK